MSIADDRMINDVDHGFQKDILEVIDQYTGNSDSYFFKVEDRIGVQFDIREDTFSVTGENTLDLRENIMDEISEMDEYPDFKNIDFYNAINDVMTETERAEEDSFFNDPNDSNDEFFKDFVGSSDNAKDFAGSSDNANDEFFKDFVGSLDNTDYDTNKDISPSEKDRDLSSASEYDPNEEIPLDVYGPLFETSEEGPVEELVTEEEYPVEESEEEPVTEEEYPVEESEEEPVTEEEPEKKSSGIVTSAETLSEASDICREVVNDVSMPRGVSLYFNEINFESGMMQFSILVPTQSEDKKVPREKIELEVNPCSSREEILAGLSTEIKDLQYEKIEEKISNLEIENPDNRGELLSVIFHDPVISKLSEIKDCFDNFEGRLVREFGIEMFPNDRDIVRETGEVSDDIMKRLEILNPSVDFNSFDYVEKEKDGVIFSKANKTGVWVNTEKSVELANPQNFSPEERAKQLGILQECKEEILKAKEAMGLLEERLPQDQYKNNTYYKMMEVNIQEQSVRYEKAGGKIGSGFMQRVATPLERRNMNLSWRRTDIIQSNHVLRQAGIDKDKVNQINGKKCFGGVHGWASQVVQTYKLGIEHKNAVITDRKDYIEKNIDKENRTFAGISKEDFGKIQNSIDKTLPPGYSSVIYINKDHLEVTIYAKGDHVHTELERFEMKGDPEKVICEKIAEEIDPKQKELQEWKETYIEKENTDDPKDVEKTSDADDSKDVDRDDPKDVENSADKVKDSSDTDDSKDVDKDESKDVEDSTDKSEEKSQDVEKSEKDSSDVDNSEDKVEDDSPDADKSKDIDKENSQHVEDSTDKPEEKSQDVERSEEDSSDVDNSEDKVEDDSPDTDDFKDVDEDEPKDVEDSTDKSEEKSQDVEKSEEDSSDVDDSTDKSEEVSPDIEESKDIDKDDPQDVDNSVDTEKADFADKFEKNYQNIDKNFKDAADKSEGAEPLDMEKNNLQNTENESEIMEKNEERIQDVDKSEDTPIEKDNSDNNTKDDVSEEKSFFDKIKDFFGFSDDSKADQDQMEKEINDMADDISKEIDQVDFSEDSIESSQFDLDEKEDFNKDFENDFERYRW